MSAVFIGTAITIAILSWRVNHLSNINAQNHVTLHNYERTIDHLKEFYAMREAVSKQDNLDSLANEDSKSNVITKIEGMSDEENGTISPVLHYAIDSLRRDQAATRSD